MLDLFRQLHEQGTTIIVVTHDALGRLLRTTRNHAQPRVCSSASSGTTRRRNARTKRPGGQAAFTGSAAEGAQNGGIAISFADPTKAAKTGDTDAANVAVAAGVARRYGRRARRHERGAGMSTAQSNAVKVIALSAASIALLSACGEPKATPMDDEYAGNSGRKRAIAGK